MTEEFRHADALRSADVPHRLSPEAREAIAGMLTMAIDAVTAAAASGGVDPEN